MASAARARLAFAADYPSLAAAGTIFAELSPFVGVLKIGLELYIREGAAAVEAGRLAGLDVFADLKLHDIPETVDRAVGSVCSLGARYVTVHASGGPRMLERAAIRAEREGTGLSVLAVTVLTSLDADDLRAVGVGCEPRDQVVRLARLALASGVSGLVCSAAEAAELRRVLGHTPILVTPGIRAAHADDDQKRVATPEQAVTDGASLLVVGRPIRDASDPVAAAEEHVRAIERALRAKTANP
ncbi:MAG: orotidine-5'-phosphate decarboxylase [Polyangiaceae bacterium]|nr:orotidine-5'-phosphate decarboxylase [Polyangiaceae bacterium]